MTAVVGRGAKSSCRIAARTAGVHCREQWAVVRLVWKELLSARCPPAKLERAIDCMRLITGRTARPSSGISTICERCSHRSLLSCSVAALWQRAEAMAWCIAKIRKLRSSRKVEPDVSWHGLVWGAGAAERNLNARSSSSEPIGGWWRHSPTCMRRVVYEAIPRSHRVPCNGSSVRLGIG
jgi:hypothetical protein